MGRGYIDYRPVRTQPVADEAEVQAMLARVKKRAEVIVNGGGGEQIPTAHTGAAASTPAAPPPNSQPSEAAQSPKAKLEWKKRDDYCIESTCGRYRIRKQVDQHAGANREATFLYHVYRVTTTWEFSLGARSDAKEARNAAQSDLHHANIQHAI